MNIIDARKILKIKLLESPAIIQSKKAKEAINNKADYIALGAFNSSETKKVKFRATLKDLKKFRRLTRKPLVAIGGINQYNYKKLLLNKADFLAISSFVWKNKKLKPLEAINKIK